MSRRRQPRRATTRADIVRLHGRLSTQAFEILETKNADYGGVDDGLANFRLGAKLAGISVAQAVLARVGDKLYRLGREAAGNRLRLKDDDDPDSLNLLVFVEAALRETRPRPRRRSR